MPSADVTLITPYPRVGVRHGGMSGVASYASNLVHALSDAGARVEVVAPVEPGESPHRERDGPVGVHRTFPRTSSGTARAVREALQTSAPVVHLQHEFFLYGGPASTPALVRGLQHLRRRRRSAVATLHQVVDPRNVDRGFTDMHRVRIPAWAARGGLSTMQRWLRRGADRVLVHEPAFADVLPDATVIPHGIEPASTTETCEAARHALGLEPGRLVVLCFGFLAPYKGLETVLEAGRLAGPSVQVVVAGGEHPRLKAAGDSYDAFLRERYGEVAHFTGRVPDGEVARWFAAADVAAFMYPRPFSSSGALALAIAHGTPVLASPELAATASLPQSLVTAREPNAIALRLQALAADRQELTRARQETAGLAPARAWPAIARRHLELYEEVRRERRFARR